MTKFEVNKHYSIGTPEHGLQITVECVKRSAKFVTLETANMGEIRVNVASMYDECESVVIYSDIVKATEEHKSLEQQIKERDQ